MELSKEQQEILIHELVGDLSQDLEECSYNEHDVRTWLNDREAFLSQYEFALKDRPHVVDDLNKCYAVTNGEELYSLLVAVVRKYRGWPVNWSSRKKDLDPLTPAELKLIEES